MKSLQIINNLSTGGAEKLILDTIPLLRNRGITIDLLVLDGVDYPYMKQLKQLNCCNIFSLGKSSLYNPLYIYRIIPYIKQYDIVHVHLFPAQYWVAIAKFLSFSKVKLIFTEHSTSNRRMQNFWFKILDKNIYRFYDRIICITNEVRLELLKHCKFKETDIVVIENGVNLNSIIESSAIPRQEIHADILETDKLLIQVAGFRIEKDQKTVIKSLQYLDSNIKLILVGDGIFRKDCEELVDELGLNNRVLFLGIRTDVSKLLKAIDISIVSSHWEGFGLVAVESMASGKPLIASNVQGLSNVVDGGGILFEKGNERELAKKIQELFNDNDYYNKTVYEGKQIAKKYDINRMLDNQLDLYYKLLK